MDGQSRRRWAAEEKLAIIEESSAGKRKQSKPEAQRKEKTPVCGQWRQN